jgi:hypothetical protein
MPIDALKRNENNIEEKKVLIKPLKEHSKKFQISTTEFPRIIDYLKAEGYEETARVCEIDFVLLATKLKIRFMNGRIFFIPFSDGNINATGFPLEMFNQELKDKIIKFKNEESIDRYIQLFFDLFESYNDTLIIIKKNRIYLVSTENELENIRLDSNIIIAKVNLKNQQKEDVKHIDGGMIEINVEDEQRLEEIVKKLEKDLNLHNPIRKHYYEMVENNEFKLREKS